MSHAVGSLVHARGREWIVLPESSEGLLVLRPLGGTDDEVAGLWLPLEGQDVRPAVLTLPDPAAVGDHRACGLLRDALRLGFRSSAGPFRSFGRIAVDPRPYQLVPLLMALKLDPVRLLIADDVGIGKTVEALLIARELLDQGTIRRFAVLCGPQLAEQWQRELRTKFHIEAQLVLPSTVTRLERRLGVGESLFDVSPFTVVSADYIKSERRRDDFLRAAPELVIVDEAHTCVDAGDSSRGRHQRYQLLRGLCEQDPPRHLLLLSATPHSGKEEAFRNLLSLAGVEPQALGDHPSEEDRAAIARHFVQRRRADIRAYLDEATPFPKRESTEETYRLHPDYRRLFDRCIDLARSVATQDGGGKHRQRVRWWSALALLRSLASSPAAAAATLRNRAAAADTTTVEEADEVGRHTVLDLAEDASAEAADVPPGSDYSEEDDRARVRRSLLDLAREAERLQGGKDLKLARCVEMVGRLVADGFNPILFCRFIPTAEYVAAAVRDALGKARVAVVTGALPPVEREARIHALASDGGSRVLVATDCLSEGINLQHAFNAVVHYDLAWNPTRHEQREGRVDRFNQPRPIVRTVTYWGADNQIDGVVLDVLLRKHQAIRKRLGISVPVPVDSDQVVEAIMEGLLLRGAGGQLQLDVVAEAEQRELFAEWDDAAEREARSRTRFAQAALRPEVVAAEVAAARRAIGSPADVERFVREAAPALGAVVSGSRDGPVELDWRGAEPAVQELAARELAGADQVMARFQLPVSSGEVHLSRTHPLVERLAAHVLDTALDPQLDGIARRCGAIRTRAVAVRTTLVLVRFRFHLVAFSREGERPLLAEDARVLGYTGPPDQATWLPDEEAEALLSARPDANVGPDQAASFVLRVVDGWQALAPELGAKAERLAAELVDQHRRVRDAARRTGIRFTARPHLPPDVLGVYVLLPVATEAAP